MIVGMDFGTTNSGMAVYDGHQLRLIPLDPASTNPYVVRSALYITNDRAVHIGQRAVETYYQQNLGRPSRYEQVRVGEIELTFAELPSFIRDVFVERDVFSPGRLFLSFKMGLSSTNFLGTLVGSHYYFLEDIIAVYLYTTRKRAEAFLQTELDTIVLGRPVYFSDDPTHNDLARERLLQAAFRAGYKTVYLQHEPVAAAYYYETLVKREQNVLIFDFGGGTLDISILRLGNHRTRRVLATGGIPIAGDVFDRKIVRTRLPPHLGEGDTYRAGRQDLPIPSSFYEAFSNWQELLALQRTDRIERLQHIQRTARNPQKIKSLISLIQSNYGLKMFDVAEASKRRLSENGQTPLTFDGPGFSVYETLTRADFERLIRTDIRAIAQRLDEVVREAGLTANQIDAVIRTGGSSQIPAFIDLLEQRFGAKKVRDLDTFSSVTSGLGVIAHEVETGSADLPAYTPQTQTGGDYLNNKTQGGIPVIELDLLKKRIDLSEQEQPIDEKADVLMARASDGSFITVPLHPSGMEIPLEPISLPYDLHPPIEALSADERVVLMTTDYRFLVRSVRELADLYAAKLDLATIEGFHTDVFGNEMICALASWSALQQASSLVLLSTRGYARLVAAEPFLARLNHPYQIQRSRGYPAALLPAAHEIVVINQAGRAVRMCVSQLSTLEQRLMQLSGESEIIGVFALDEPGEIVIATTSGYGQRILSTAIPETTSLNTTGAKIVMRTQPVIARLYHPEQHLWALTSRRLARLDQNTIPLLAPGATTEYKLLRLKKGERLISLIYTH